MATKLLLMGKVGQGKSTLGDFMVKKPGTFVANAGVASVAGESKLASVSYEGEEYQVIDTPGLCDSEETLTDKMALIETSRDIKLGFGDGKQGVDAVLLVFSAGERFGKDAEELVSSLDKLDDFWSYVIVVFTNADKLESNDPKGKLFEIIRSPRASSSLKFLAKKVDERIVVLNAKDTSEEYYKMKMNEIIPNVKEIQRKHNYYEPYTSEALRKAAEEIKTKQELLDQTREELERNMEENVTHVAALENALKSLRVDLESKKK